MVVGDVPDINSMTVSARPGGVEMSLAGLANAKFSSVAWNDRAESTWSSDAGYGDGQEASIFVDSQESRVRAGRSEFNGGNGISCVFKVYYYGGTPPQNGALVGIDRMRPGDLEVTDAAHGLDELVVGVIAGEAWSGATWHEGDAVITVGKVNDPDPICYRVVVMGRAVVEAEAMAAPIRVGDLLVRSNNRDGAVMSAAAMGGPPAPGTVVGKALMPMPHGYGQILMLVQPQ
jgi:hypothetical protein